MSDVADDSAAVLIRCSTETSKAAAERLVAVVRQAIEVRRLQAAYFANRTQANLIASKQAERILDKMFEAR